LTTRTLVAPTTPASTANEPSAYNKTSMSTFGKRTLAFDRTPGLELSSPTSHCYAGDHQQYLAKNPFGYRCPSNTGVKFPATA
jgi:hypothetical protein